MQTARHQSYVKKNNTCDVGGALITPAQDQEMARRSCSDQKCIDYESDAI